MIDVNIDGKVLQMEVDSDAPCDIINVNTLRTIKPKLTLKKQIGSLLVILVTKFHVSVVF